MKPNYISGNEVLLDILNNLMVLSSLIVRLYQQNVTTHCQCDEHKNIIQALQRGDSTVAQRLMQEHLRELEEQLDISEQAPFTMTLQQALNLPQS